MESLFVEIKTIQQRNSSSIIYRKPHINTNDSINSLSNILNIIQKGNKDLKLNLVKSETSKPVSELIPLFHNPSHYNSIINPT